jgi:circadian clock protein KaiB
MLLDSDTQYLLKLFVAGASVLTDQAVANLVRICEDEFRGCYELVVIDVLSQPAIAEEEKILAAPTLIMESPLPVRRIIGDFSNKEKVLAGMGLFPH